jgi:hypothetical protein
LSELNCDRKIAQLGAYIVDIHGVSPTKEMLGRDRDTEAGQMLGRYYGDPNPKFTKMVDSIAGVNAGDRTRKSAIRSALQLIQQYGPNGIQVFVATQKSKFQAELAGVAA